MVEEINAIDAAARLASNQDSICLLDVREVMELQAASIEGALHIPMAETPARLDDIDRNKTIVVMCHLGGRSAQVAGFLVAQGYENVFNLSGGIDAWSQTVDPSIPRY